MDEEKEKLVPTSKLIDLAKEKEIDLGKGDPNERLRYYTKLGLIPHAQRKIDPKDAKKTVGHYPAWVLDRLENIEKLRSQGFSAREVKERLKTKEPGAVPQEVVKNLTEPLVSSIEDLSEKIESAQGERKGEFLRFAGKLILVFLLALSIFAVAIFFVPKIFLPVIEPIQDELRKLTEKIQFPLVPEQPKPAELPPGLSQDALGNIENLGLADGRFDLTAQNVIRNSSFEANGSGSPRLWTYYNESTSANTFVTQEGIHTGGNGLKFKGSTGSPYLGVYQPEVKTDWTKPYSLSAWIKVLNAPKITVKLGFWDKPNNKRVETQEFSFSGTADWQRLTLTADNRGVYVGKDWLPLIEVYGLTSGTVYIDDVQLEESAGPTLYHALNGAILGDGSISTDASGNLFPTQDAIGDLGKSGGRFRKLQLFKASINEEGTLDLSGNASVAGSLSAGSVNSHLIPNADNTYDLGSSTSKWRNLYLSGSTASSGNITISNTNPTLTFEDTTASEDDWNINVDANALVIRNTTDSANYFTLSGTGDLTLTQDLAVNGDDITSDGDLTITASGGNIITGNALNVGGAAAAAYNFFADSTATAGSVASDNDLYVEDVLEVDGSLVLNSSTFNCTDCIDFDDLVDAMTIDAATTIASTVAATSLDLNVTPAGTASTPVGLEITPTLGVDATDQTLIGLNINANSNSNDDSGDLFYAIQLANITAATGTQTAIRFGSGYDNLIEVEGSTDDTVETFLAFTDPTTSDKTITFPNATGTICISGDTCATSGIVGYWSRNDTTDTLSPATAGDVIDLGTIQGGDTGFSTTLPNLLGASATGISVTYGSSATSGTATGVSLTIGSAGAGTTQNGLLITPPASTGAGTTNGINIGSITTSNGTDTAINIGSGWDTDIAFVDSSVILDGPASSSITFQDFTTITATNVTAFNCTDCIDFDDIADSMTLDANLTISASASNYSINIDSGNLFVDTANNRVGIGTATPTVALDVTGNTLVSGTMGLAGGAVDSTIGLNINTTSATLQYGINVNLLASGAQSSTALAFTAEISGAAAAADSATGVSGFVRSAATSGVIDKLIVFDAGWRTTLLSTVAINRGIGLLVRTPITSGVSVITDTFGIQIQNQVANASRQTNATAIEIAAQTAAGTATYQIRELGTTGFNILAGNTRIGATTNPTVALDVTGAALISSTLGVTGDTTLTGDLAVNGDDITSDGDLTITAAGGNIITGNALNVGGAVAQAYNFFADSTATAGSVAGDNDLYVEDVLEVDGSLVLNSSTFNCTDCIDFDDLENTLDVDEATTVNLSTLGLTLDANGSANLTVNLSSTGDFVIQDAGTTFVTFSDAGLTTFVSDVDLTLAETENFTITNAPTGTTAVNLISASLTNNTTSGFQRVALFSAGGTGTTEDILLLSTGASTGTATTGLTIENNSSATMSDGIRILATGGTITDGIQIGSSTQVITNAINIASTGVTTDIILQNAETIDNNTDGTVTITTTTLSLSGTTTFNCTDCIDFDDIADSMTLDGTAGASSLSINPDNTRGITIAPTLSGGARSVDVLTISQANDATNNSTANLLQLTNSDTGSIAAVLDISQVAGGTGIIIGGINGGTEIYLNSVITSGEAIHLEQTARLTSGRSIRMTGTSTTAPSAFTGDIILIDPVRQIASGTTSINDTGNYLDIQRSNTVSVAATFTISGDLATLSSNCTPSGGGTCTDTSNILSLTQNYSSASGAVLDITNAGTGSGILLTSSSTGVLATLNASGAGTTADGLLIQQTGAGTITDAIDVSDETITNAINVGANTILGTTADIDLTNFDVTGSSGNITTAGDIAVNGGDITSTSATLTLGGSITTLNCTDCIDFDDLEDTLDLDANLTLNQTTNTWTQSFTGTTTDAITLTTSSLTTGTALALASTATAFDGELLTLSKTASSGSTAFTSDIANITYSQTFNATVASASTGNVLDISRAITVDDSTAGAISATISGAVLTISDNCTQGTADTCTNSANVLSLTQSYASASGAVLAISNAGTGAGISLAGAGTRSINSTSGNLTISTTTSGTLALTSAGALNLTGAAASTWDIGANTLSLQTTNNGAITTGTGLLTLGGDIRINGNDIQDSGGTNRITLATASPQTAITGDLDVSGSAAFGNLAAITTGRILNLEAAAAVQSLIGGYFRSVNTSTSGSDNAFGIVGVAQWSGSSTAIGALAIGVDFQTIHNSSRSLTSLIGARFYLRVTSLGTGALMSATAFSVLAPEWSGAEPTNVYAMDIPNMGHANISNLRIIRIVDQTAAITTTRLISQEGTTGVNVLAAPTTIGADAAPTAGIELDVTGDIAASGNLVVGANAAATADSIEILNATSTKGFRVQSDVNNDTLRLLIADTATAGAADAEISVSDGDLTLSPNTGVINLSGSATTINVGDSGSPTTLTIQNPNTSVANVTVEGVVAATFNAANSAALCWDNAGSSEITDCTGGPSADLAEWVSTDGTPQPADVVKVSEVKRASDQQVFESDVWVTQSSVPYEAGLIGIIATAPELVMSDPNIKTNPQPVALAGLVPVKVSLENGPIEPGDFLTSSSTSGVAMKATKAGPVVGKALEAFPSNKSEALNTKSETNSNVSNLENCDLENCLEFSNSNLEFGTIMVFVNVSYYVGDLNELGLLLLEEPQEEPRLEQSATESAKLEGQPEETITLAQIASRSALQQVQGTGQASSATESATTQTSPAFKDALISQIVKVLKSFGITVKDAIVSIKDAVIEKLTVKELTVDNFQSESQSETVGEAMIAAGEKEVKIQNSKIKENSKVFVTFRGKPQEFGWSVKEIKEGEYFVIEISRVLSEDLIFDYWIVQTTKPLELKPEYGQTQSPSPTPTPEQTNSSEPQPTLTPTLTPTPVETPTSQPVQEATSSAVAN